MKVNPSQAPGPPHVLFLLEEGDRAASLPDVRCFFHTTDVRRNEGPLAFWFVFWDIREKSTSVYRLSDLQGLYREGFLG